MKNKVWLAALPIIVLFALFQTTFDWGEQGKLNSVFLRDKVYEFSKNANGILTNIKFKIRGPEKPNSNVVIVYADNKSVEQIGRWPWSRNVYGELVKSIFDLEAKVVGLDVVFSEPEKSIDPNILEQIKTSNPKIYEEIIATEGDPFFRDVIALNKERLVLGYTTQSCQPRYRQSLEECPVEVKEQNEYIKSEIEKFALPQTNQSSDEKTMNSTMLNIVQGIFNIGIFKDAAQHAGYFDAYPDPDGFIRRYPIFTNHQDKTYPSLALKMAEIFKQDTAVIEFSDDTRVDQVYFSKEKNDPIPVSKLGNMDLNFKGYEVFPAISAFEVIVANQSPEPEVRNKMIEKLKGKAVLFGVSATGIYDMRAFPFSSNSPGVEGHATALSNLLDHDVLMSASGIKMEWLPLALIIVVGLIFALLFSHVEAIPGLVIFAVFIAGFGYLDVVFLFKQHINLPSAFLYLETFLIFALTLSIRYVLEEKNKKHIKAAFSFYLAPQVVDLVLKDPSKLALGGERRDLAIMFSDLRGFTTISEKMDPKTLSQFLNEYLTAMTNVVFEHEGTLDKYIGDAVMAFWGAPIHQDDHALRACMAAIKMQRKLREIAPDFKKRYDIDVGMGVGINAGPVSVGNMGSQKIFEYTVIGDHVNLASRLESLTRLYGVDVLTTKATVDLVEEKYPGQIFHRILDNVKVKGKKVATELVEIDLEPFNKEACDLFATARERFMQMKWDEAIELYKKSGEIFQKHHGREDVTSKIFMERCEQFKQNPPPEGWDGSIEMRSK